MYNSYTAYIQRFKLFVWLFERLVFVLVETDGVAEHRRIEFGISPAFVSSFFTHITLDLAV